MVALRKIQIGFGGLASWGHEMGNGADGQRRIYHGQLRQRGGMFLLNGRNLRSLCCWPWLLCVAFAGLCCAATLVGSAVLLHIVLAGKCLVAFGAVGVLLAGVLLGVARSMARCGEVVVAGVLFGHGTRIAVLLGSLGRHGGGGGRGRGRGRGRSGMLVVKRVVRREVGRLRNIDGVVGERIRRMREGGIVGVEVLVLGEEAVVGEDGRVQAVGRESKGEIRGDGRRCGHGGRLGRIAANEARCQW